MNKFMTSKKSVLRPNNIIKAPVGKKNKKDNCKCLPITKKYKQIKMIRTKVRKVARTGNLLTEWAENESSRGDLKENLRVLRSSSSSDSLIYIGTYPSQDIQIKNMPVIDLTKSTQSIPSNGTVYSKSLKTIYFPSRNFDRNDSHRKSLATTSLITLPVIKKPKLVRKLNSATSLAKTNKLSILEIPDAYFNESDMSIDVSPFKNKTNLTVSDYKIIDWILEQEDMDQSIIPNMSDHDSSLDTGIESIEEMCQIYGVTSNDSFP